VLREIKWEMGYGNTKWKYGRNTMEIIRASSEK
jgi:hypothetical protein